MNYWSDSSENEHLSAALFYTSHLKTCHNNQWSCGLLLTCLPARLWIPKDGGKCVEYSFFHQKLKDKGWKKDLSCILLIDPTCLLHKTYPCSKQINNHRATTCIIYIPTTALAASSSCTHTTFRAVTAQALNTVQAPAPHNFGSLKEGVEEQLVCLALDKQHYQEASRQLEKEQSLSHRQVKHANKCCKLSWDLTWVQACI